jgi:prepilin-type N-terminal cleavage/methylation domain-containing protein
MKTTSKGFTLLELIVSVSLIAILAVVSVPLYKQYQVKARTSEAYLYLSTINKLEQAWMAEYNVYATCLSLMGLEDREVGGPEYFSIGFSSVALVATTAEINNLSTANGAPMECATGGHWMSAEPNPAVVHWYQGNKSIGQTSAPNPLEFTLKSTLTGVDWSGQAYLVAAVGNINPETSALIRTDWLVSPAFASDVPNYNSVELDSAIAYVMDHQGGIAKNESFINIFSSLGLGGPDFSLSFGENNDTALNELLDQYINANENEQDHNPEEPPVITVVDTKIEKDPASADERR